WEPEIIQMIGRHWKTREPIPKQMAEKIAQSRTIFFNHKMRRRLADSVLDMRLHSSRPRPAQVVERETYEEYYYPLPEGVSVIGSFGYFSGYDSMYWAYQWDEALADRQVAKFKASPGGLLGTEGTMAYRNDFFKVGGRYRSADLIRNNLGGKFQF